MQQWEITMTAMAIKWSVTDCVVFWMLYCNWCMKWHSCYFLMTYSKLRGSHTHCCNKGAVYTTHWLLLPDYHEHSFNPWVCIYIYESTYGWLWYSVWPLLRSSHSHSSFSLNLGHYISITSKYRSHYKLFMEMETFI